ncbi:possible glycosyltransferase [Saccharopolyspora erythraea NRRL 2338]|uniref:Possible glycosyltransferase n=2 Tax=Saccharopolyspora erythraea TaxID=1836 RepID=A4FLJ3_SACEN|nr:possible glycosyltransferase [Saccharopolyspora erythraea NRRL 2338]
MQASSFLRTPPLPSRTGPSAPQELQQMAEDAPTTTEPPAPLRPQRPRSGGVLLAHRTFFAGPSTLAPDELYSRARRGAVLRERERVTLEPHTRLTTNTYFGRFAASHWQRWTEIGVVEVTALVHGAGRVSVAASDSSGDQRTVSTTVVAGPEEQAVRLTARIDRFVDGGALWLDVETDDEQVTVENVRWLVQAPRTPRPTALVISTRNRPDHCVDALVELVRDTELLGRLDSVHVVDQGEDRAEDHSRFGFVSRVLGPKLHYLRQQNLGIAGGFSRGLAESVRCRGRVNTLLIDDDVRLEPETLSRLMTFAACTAEPSLVGGQLLCELHPDQLDPVLAGSGPDLTGLGTAPAGGPVPQVSGPAAQSLDPGAPASVLRRTLDRREDAASNAGWCCLVPSEVAARIGYPLPFFQQWDDVEFGLRARAAGYPTIALPGAGVWHGDSRWRSQDDHAGYFHLRNGLITAGLHGGFGVAVVARRMLGALVEDLVSMRYGLAATRIRAVEDFLRGPEGLDDGGIEAAVLVAKLRAEFPETHCVPAVEVPGEVALCAAGPAPRRPRLAMLARLVAHLCNRPAGSAAIQAADEKWWHVSRFRTAVVTDPSQRGVRVRRFDRELMLRLCRRSALVLWRFLRHGARTAHRYRETASTLSSPANWERLFSGPAR